ncbi:MAG: sensor histidine kinase [Pseudonocardiaceae bacterium]
MTVAIGAAGSLFMGIAGWLARHRRTVWASAALALYSVAVVPFTVVLTVSEQAGMTLSAVRLVAYWAVVGLLALAVRPPRITVRLASGVLAGCGLLSAWAAVGIVPLGHEMINFTTSLTVAQAALVTALCCLAVTVAVHGWRERNEPLRRVGLGLLLIVASHLYGIVSAMPISEPDLAFSVPRLIGLMLVAVASAQLARREWHANQVVYSELRVARLRQVHRERADQQTAERDHELRNALASLAGFHLLLGESLDTDEAQRLRRAVASELRRLAAMLGEPQPDGGTEGYLVSEVLANIVTLRQAAGCDVELDVDERLRVRGSPDVLAQVVTNLLANCERHAPGSPVRVRASMDQHRVLVEVTDDGPGIPAHLRWTVLERGTRSGHTGGSGLGLHICRRLLTAQGGALRVVGAPPGHAGCTVLVELPSALDYRPAPQPAPLRIAD